MPTALLPILRTILSALAIGIAVSACAQGALAGADSWKEEVLLHDGQKIIVERSQTYAGSRDIGQSVPVGQHTIMFTPPNANSKISWTSEYGEDVRRTNFNVLALHIKQATPYLVTEPNLCLSYNKWGRPNPPYVFFRHDGSTWQRVELADVPIEFKAINLIVNTGRLPDIRESSKATGYVPFESVQKINKDLRAPEVKTILREPLTKERILVMCRELIFYKGMWIGPGDSAGNRILDAQSK